MHGDSQYCESLLQGVVLSSQSRLHTARSYASVKVLWKAGGQSCGQNGLHVLV